MKTPKQLTIQSFFNKSSITKSEETNGSPPKKRTKRDESPTKEGSKLQEHGDTISLSPLQKKTIEVNKTKAKVKLLAKANGALAPNIGISWFTALEPHFHKDYFNKLGHFVTMERSKFTVYPLVEDVYSWTRMCTVAEVKVVILGQDPYHGPKQAHGLSFSVPNGVRIPPSLLNIYKELEQDIDGFTKPSHGNLSGWAKQGVLLLNACLTVRSGLANSHKDRGWETFTDGVIKHLSDNSHGVVFLLWGSYAQKKGEMIDKKKHHIFKTVHPSPLSASRGFFGCKHFSKANEALKKGGKKEIDWTDLPSE